MVAHSLATHAHVHPVHVPAGHAEARTRWVVGFTLAMMVAELVVGYWSRSIALTADGWHMGTHVVALGLSLAAYWYARRHARSGRYAFGTGKVYALAGFTSALLLAVVAAWMAVESIARLMHPTAVNFDDALPVAVVGLVVNLLSAWLLAGAHGHDHGHGHDHDHAHDDHDDHDHDDHGATDHNLRGAYLHVLADALTSVLAIAALVAGRYADLGFLDPAMGLVGGAVILWWAVGLGRSTTRELLDAVPGGDLVKAIAGAAEATGGAQVVDLHVWTLGPGQHSAVLSVVTSAAGSTEAVRAAVLAKVPLAHLTVEVQRCDACAQAPATAV